MAKRYNIIVVEQDSKHVVYEEELIIKSVEPGVVFIDNLIHTMFCAIEEAIAENE